MNLFSNRRSMMQPAVDRPLRSLLSPRQAMVAFGLSFIGVTGALEMLVREMTGASMMARGELGLLRIALFFVANDVAIGLVLMLTLVMRFRGVPPLAPPQLQVPPVSILISAWNEADNIVETVRRWAAQRGTQFEIIVGDDGSTDGTAEALIRELHLVSLAAGRFEGCENGVPVRLFVLPHTGKGSTLNSISAHTRHDVLVTVDADTTPAPDALALLAAAFVDPEVDSGTGVVTIRNGRKGWLLANQSAEYLKNAWVRIAWSSLGGLEQVPGAFAAVRASVFRAAGGFPTDSITEDYELTFRFIQVGLERGRAPKVVTVPRSQVFTDGPPTVAGFVRQRTRWFAGFLSTLFRYRHLLFNPGAGAFGLVRLPLKLVDAVLPFLAVTTLVVLVRDGFVAALGLSGVALALFAARWLWDLFVYACATAASWRLGSVEMTKASMPPGAIGWLLTGFEALTYVWLKQFSALRGVTWAIRRARTWEASRERVTARSG